MSAKEKHFFRKKFLGLTDDTDDNYLKLFNLICRQAERSSVYDESEIKTENFTGKFVKNLSFHKNYLYNLLTECLHFYSRDKRKQSVAAKLLSQAETLSERLLYDQSIKIIRRLKRYCYENEFYAPLWTALKLEQNVLRHLLSVEEYTEAAGQLFEEQYEALDLQKNSTDYFRLNESVGIFLRTFGSGRIRGKEEMAAFEKIFDTPLLKDYSNARSFLPKYIFHNMHLQYHLTLETPEKAIIHAREAVKVCEDNLEKMQGKIDNYIYSLNNMLNVACRLRNFDEGIATAEKLYAIPSKFPDSVTESNRVFIFYSYYSLMLIMSMQASDAGSMKKLESRIAEELPAYEENIPLYQRIILYYFLSAANFMQSDFERCIHWNGRINNLGKTDLCEDYQCYSRIIQLIAFYELGYHDSMEYALKSVYHFISRKQKLYRYENIILKYLRTTFRIKTGKELMEMFEDMKRELKVLEKDPYERNALDAFNIIYWLESKITNTPLLTVIKRSHGDA